MSTSCRRRSHKLTTDHQQKIDASNRQIEALKGAVIGLQKLVTDMQAAQNKAAEDAKKAAAPRRRMLRLLQRMPRRQRTARSSDAPARHDTRYCSMTALSGS